jgi:TatD DNase family protein
LSVALIDTHAHLDGDAFAADIADAVARAGAAGVAQIVSAGQDEASSRAALQISERFEQVYGAVGIHPHLAHSAGDAAWLPRTAAHPRVVAIGEIGLDYHYNNSPPDVQREVLAKQLTLAGELGLPVIMHNRESDDDLAAILHARFERGRLGVVHCFTGSYDVGARFIDEFDVYLGIGGAVTFKNARVLHDAAARLPLERLVLETDCPYMTPVPQRGKRNEPAFIALTAARLAELRGATVESIALATTANARRLFPRLPGD